MQPADARVVTLPGGRPPWTDTGLALGDGDAGTIWRGSQPTQTRDAPVAGTLRLATIQGEWGTRGGRLATPVEAYAGVTGALDAVCLR